MKLCFFLSLDASDFFFFFFAILIFVHFITFERSFLIPVYLSQLLCGTETGFTDSTALIAIYF